MKKVQKAIKNQNKPRELSDKLFSLLKTGDSCTKAKDVI